MIRDSHKQKSKREKVRERGNLFIFFFNKLISYLYSLNFGLAYEYISKGLDH